MAETYRFDPDLVHTERDAVLTWCRANDLVPEDIPTDATVTIANGHATVEHYVVPETGKSNRVMDPDTNLPKRTTRTVPLLVKPELASLKPVEGAS